MHGGTYFLGGVGTLELSGEDSGTSWIADPAARVEDLRKTGTLTIVLSGVVGRDRGGDASKVRLDWVKNEKGGLVVSRVDDEPASTATAVVDGSGASGGGGGGGGGGCASKAGKPGKANRMPPSKVKAARTSRPNDDSYMTNFS